MHYLIHWPTIVRKNRPMRTFWALNFERLYGIFKRPTHIMNNFRSPLLTLAYKPQCASLNGHLDKVFLADCVEFSNSVEATISQFPNHDFDPLLSTVSQTTIHGAHRHRNSERYIIV